MFDSLCPATLPLLPPLLPASTSHPLPQPLLTRILSYHIIPSGALMSSNLTDGQNLTTLITDVPPLNVSMMGGNVSFVGATNNATVVQPDIMIGQSVVHLVDTVLVPPSLNGTTNATNSAAGTGGSLPGATGAAGAMPTSENATSGAGANSTGATGATNATSAAGGAGPPAPEAAAGANNTAGGAAGGAGGASPAPADNTTAASGGASGPSANTGGATGGSPSP